ncbi:MAG: amidase [Myxococcota bacterium]
MIEPYASAREVAAAIRSRSVSSVEVTTAALARIAALDAGPAGLGAFVQVIGPRALAEARLRDATPSDAPFHGVPIGIKDLNFARGTFTRFGSRAYRWLWTPIDDAVSAALRRAGFVIVGKLATSEFGALPITETDLHPPVRNPWDPTRTAGGSSGGSAAAVAAGLVPVAHGSDGGGSIRIPAAFCGLYGLKCSRGVAPLAHGRVDVLGLGVEGALASTVGDGAAVTAILAGRPLAPVRPHPARLRVRVTTEARIAPTGAAYAAATERVAAALADLGHHVEPAPPLDGTLDEFLPLWQRLVADIPIWRESTLQPVTRWLRAIGRTHRHDHVRDAHGGLERKIRDWFGDADLVVTPTVGAPPPRLGAFGSLGPEAVFEAIAPLGQFTAPFNLSGQPAASIPAGFTDDGTPIGVQLVGRPGEDALVIEVSRALERAMPWRGQHPT